MGYEPADLHLQYQITRGDIWQARLANGGAARKKEDKDWVIAILVGARKWHGYSRSLVEVANLEWMVLQSVVVEGMQRST